MKNGTGILAAVLLLAAVGSPSSKSGGRGDPGGMMTPVTTFIRDIGTPAAQEIYVEAIDVQAREITLAVRTNIGGTLRTTLDVDIVADLDPEHIDGLVAAVESDFHVVGEAIQRAVRERSSFNLIHEDARQGRRAVAAFVRRSCTARPI